MAQQLSWSAAKAADYGRMCSPIADIDIENSFWNGSLHGSSMT
jgi:hypothetical protein